MKVIVSILLLLLASLLALIVFAPYGDTALAKTEETEILEASRASLRETLAPATLRPTLIPAPVPTKGPTPEPMQTPTFAPASVPASAPTLTPTAAPTALPAPEPTVTPVPTEEEFLPDDEGLFDDDLPEAPPPPTPEPIFLVLPNDDLSSQPHYIAQNDTRYRAYMAANAWSTARMTIALVNAGVDYGVYNNVQIISNPDSLLALCNKNRQLSPDYVPDGMRAIAGTKELLRGDAADDYERMTAAMQADLGLGLHVVSGYRGYKMQESVHARYARRDGQAVADLYSARAGHSEHQLGLTIDITQKAPSGGLRRLRFEESPQYAWLIDNAHKYGYILRYPDGWTPVTGYIYEPWHWRYIGVEDATRYYEGGYMVLEEYVGELAINS